MSTLLLRNVGSKLVFVYASLRSLSTAVRITTYFLTSSNNNGTFTTALGPVCHTNWLNGPPCRVDNVALLASVGKACVLCNRVRTVRCKVGCEFSHSCAIHWLSVMVFGVHVDHAVGVVADGAGMLCPEHFFKIDNRENCIFARI